MKKIIILLLVTVSILSCINKQQPVVKSKVKKALISFPGAEGYGAYAKGGRGGDVYEVTNLNDSGPGSFRNGIKTAKGPRTIVFNTGGTIELKSDLVIDKPFITVAGQTAPGDGITLKDNTFCVTETHDVIVRYIRIRYGDKNKGSIDYGDPDAIRTNGITDVIFDHISASWGVDGIHDFRQKGNFTLQWSMYGEALNNSIHEDKIPHAMLSSFRELMKNITIHHNVFYSSRERYPTLGGAVKTDPNCVADFRNNLVFNWKATTNFSNCKVNVINNYYKPGESTDLKKKPMQIKSEFAEKQARGYVHGNYFPWNAAWTKDNYLAIEYTNTGKYKSTTRDKFELPENLITGEYAPKTDPAQEAYREDLLYAGASKSRDDVDKRVIKGIADGTNRLIDSQDEVGGWPVLKKGIPLLDTDKDGMPDFWERERGLNPKNAEDRNDDDDGDGYTNLEEYLNEIAMPSPIEVD